MDWLPVVSLFGVFFLLLTVGVPIACCIGLATCISILTFLPAEAAITLVAQRMASGLDSFALLAIPFFVLAGNIMNTGGIARRLIDFAELLTGRLPGSLIHCNIMANMLFGSISGSAVASAAAVGSFMSPIQKQQHYRAPFCAAANIASCPSGLLIPPSNGPDCVFPCQWRHIHWRSVSGRLPSRFTDGVEPDDSGGSVNTQGFRVTQEKPSKHSALTTTFRAMPSLLLVIVIMGGIISGLFTPTEASAIAVAYALCAGNGVLS